MMAAAAQGDDDKIIQDSGGGGEHSHDNNHGKPAPPPSSHSQATKRPGGIPSLRASRSQLKSISSAALGVSSMKAHFTSSTQLTASGASGPPSWSHDSASVIVKAPRATNLMLGFSPGDKVYTASGRTAFIRGISSLPGQSPRLWATYAAGVVPPPPKKTQGAKGARVRAHASTNHNKVVNARTWAGMDAMRKARTKRTAVGGDSRTALAHAANTNLGVSEAREGTGGLATIHVVREVVDSAATGTNASMTPHLAASGRLDTITHKPMKQPIATSFGETDKFIGTLRQHTNLQDEVTDRERWIRLTHEARAPDNDTAATVTAVGRAREFALPARPTHVRASAMYDALYDGGDSRPYARNVSENDREGWFVLRPMPEVEYMSRLSRVEGVEDRIKDSNETFPFRASNSLKTPLGLPLCELLGTARKPTLVNTEEAPDSPSDGTSVAESAAAVDEPEQNETNAGMASTAGSHHNSHHASKTVTIRPEHEKVISEIPQDVVSKSRYKNVPVERLLHTHRLYMQMNCGTERTWAPDRGPSGARRFGALDRTMPAECRIACKADSKSKRNAANLAAAKVKVKDPTKHHVRPEKDRTYYCPVEPQMPDGSNELPPGFTYSASHPGAVMFKEMEFGAWDRLASATLREGEDSNPAIRAAKAVAAAERAKHRAEAAKHALAAGGGQASAKMVARTAEAAAVANSHMIEAKAQARAATSARRAYLHERFGAASARLHDVPLYCRGEDPVFIEGQRQILEAREAVANGEKLPRTPRGDIAHTTGPLTAPRALRRAPPETLIPVTLGPDVNYRGAHTQRYWTGAAAMHDVIPASETLPAHVMHHDRRTEENAIRHSGSVASLEIRAARAMDVWSMPERAAVGMDAVDFTAPNPGDERIVPTTDGPPARTHVPATTDRNRASDAYARNVRALSTKHFVAYAQPGADIASQCGYGPLRGAGGIGSSTSATADYLPVAASETRSALLALKQVGSQTAR